MTAPLPLAGKRILNTRALHQAEEWTQKLASFGSLVLTYPCIAIKPAIRDPQTAKNIALLFAGGWEWLILTSPNAVYALAPYWQKRNRYPFRTAVIGRSTAEIVTTQWGISAELISPHASAQQLAYALVEQGCRSAFFPHSALAPSTIPTILRHHGAIVATWLAYETVCGTGGIDMVAQWPTVQAVTFTSPSAVHFFCQRWHYESGGQPLPIEGICWASIGRTTTQAAEQIGLPMTITASPSHLDALLHALISYYQGENPL